MCLPPKVLQIKYYARKECYTKGEKSKTCLSIKWVCFHMVAPHLSIILTTMAMAMLRVRNVSRIWRRSKRKWKYVHGTQSERSIHPFCVLPNTPGKFTHAVCCINCERLLAIILLTYPPCETVTRILNEHASGNDGVGGGHIKEKAKHKTTLANNIVNTPPVQIVTAIPYDFFLIRNMLC